MKVRIHCHFGWYSPFLQRRCTAMASICYIGVVSISSETMHSNGSYLFTLASSLFLQRRCTAIAAICLHWRRLRFFRDDAQQRQLFVYIGVVSNHHTKTNQSERITVSPECKPYIVLLQAE